MLIAESQLRTVIRKKLLKQKNDDQIKREKILAGLSVRNPKIKKFNLKRNTELKHSASGQFLSVVGFLGFETNPVGLFFLGKQEAEIMQNYPDDIIYVTQEDKPGRIYNRMGGGDPISNKRARELTNQKRLVYIKNPDAFKKEIWIDPKTKIKFEMFDMVYDTLADSAGAILDLFPPTAGVAAVINISQAVKKGMQALTMSGGDMISKIVDSGLSFIAAVPALGDSVAIVGNALKKMPNLKFVPGVSSLAKGLHDLINQLKPKIEETKKKILEIGKGKFDALESSIKKKGYKNMSDFIDYVLKQTLNFLEVFAGQLKKDV